MYVVGLHLHERRCHSGPSGGCGGDRSIDGRRHLSLSRLTWPSEGGVPSLFISCAWKMFFDLFSYFATFLMNPTNTEEGEVVMIFVRNVALHGTTNALLPYTIHIVNVFS